MKQCVTYGQQPRSTNPLFHIMKAATFQIEFTHSYQGCAAPQYWQRFSFCADLCLASKPLYAFSLCCALITVVCSIVVQCTFQKIRAHRIQVLLLFCHSKMRIKHSQQKGNLLCYSLSLRS